LPLTLKLSELKKGLTLRLKFPQIKKGIASEAEIAESEIESCPQEATLRLKENKEK
jgi:hypothetical protein